MSKDEIREVSSSEFELVDVSSMISEIIWNNCFYLYVTLFSIYKRIYEICHEDILYMYLPYTMKAQYRNNDGKSLYNH